MFGAHSTVYENTNVHTYAMKNSIHVYVVLVYGQTLHTHTHTHTEIQATIIGYFAFRSKIRNTYTDTVSGTRTGTNIVDSLYTHQLAQSLYRLRALCFHTHTAYTHTRAHTHIHGCVSIRSQLTQTHTHSHRKCVALSRSVGHSQWTRQR